MSKTWRVWAFLLVSLQITLPPASCEVLRQLPPAPPHLAAPRRPPSFHGGEGAPAARARAGLRHRLRLAAPARRRAAPAQGAAARDLRSQGPEGPDIPGAAPRERLPRRAVPRGARRRGKGRLLHVLDAPPAYAQPGDGRHAASGRQRLALHCRAAAGPSFSVDRLSVHNASAQHHVEVDYDFFLTAINPNKVIALWYKDDGSARLLHQGTALAKAADVGTPDDGGEDAKDFNVLLHGVGHAPPKAVEKALRGSKKEAVALELAVEVPVQVHMGALGFPAKTLAVVCEMRTAGLGKHVHISSQKCRSSFGK